jgi:hypothetical protein
VQEVDAENKAGEALDYPVGFASTAGSSQGRRADCGA